VPSLGSLFAVWCISVDTVMCSQPQMRPSNVHKGVITSSHGAVPVYAFPLWPYTGVSLVGALTFAVLKRPPSTASGGAPSTPPATAAGSPQASD